MNIEHTANPALQAMDLIVQPRVAISILEGCLLRAILEMQAPVTIYGQGRTMLPFSLPVIKVVSLHLARIEGLGSSK